MAFAVGKRILSVNLDFRLAHFQEYSILVDSNDTVKWCCSFKMLSISEIWARLVILH